MVRSNNISSPSNRACGKKVLCFVGLEDCHNQWPRPSSHVYKIALRALRRHCACFLASHGPLSTPDNSPHHISSALSVHRRDTSAHKTRTLFQLPTSPIASEDDPPSRSGGGHASMFSGSESLRQALGGGSSRSFAPSVSLSTARAGSGSLASLRVAAGAPRFSSSGMAASPADDEGRPGQGEQLRFAKNRGKR